MGSGRPGRVRYIINFMKNCFVVILACFLFLPGRSQVIFCPPGAEWHYTFYSPNMLRISNEQISYVRDSLVDNEIVKVLLHHSFYNICSGNENELTLIRQKGDTVFMRNLITEQSWQILYNYAATTGQSWQTTIDLLDPMTVPPLSVTYTVSVDSVKTTLVGSYNLRKLYVNYQVATPDGIASMPATITERFGSSMFMFSYADNYLSDCDGFDQFLCYQDSAMGLIQFTSKPCDYTTDNVGIQEIGGGSGSVQAYPNPTAGILHLNFSGNSFQGNRVYTLTDISGRELLNKILTAGEQEQQIDLSTFSAGVYLLSIKEKGEIICRTKIVKQE